MEEKNEYGFEPPKIKTVKEFDIDDQPRERAEKYGCHVLSTADLWALILRTGLPGKPITEITRDLMRDNSDSIHQLERRSRAEIQSIPGLGITKAIQIEAVMELIRRYNREIYSSRPLIKSSRDVYELMKIEIGNLPHEEVRILLLNRRNELIRQRKITTGSAAASIFDLRAILREALLERADGLVLCHNHPSGNLRPSPQDKNITAECKEGCDSIGVKMVDHIIISTQGFFSFADSGLLDPSSLKSKITRIKDNDIFGDFSI